MEVNGGIRVFDVSGKSRGADLMEIAKDAEAMLVFLAAVRLEQLGRLIKLAPNRAEFPAALSELYDKAGRTTDAAKSRELAKQLGFSFTKKTSANTTPEPE